LVWLQKDTMTFAELGLSAAVTAAVTAAGYTTPTPIQAQAIPHVLARRDVLGIAQTGTGKTAAFTLPMISLLETGRARARMPRTLILEPTRELAAQVEESFLKYGVNHRLNVALLIGGVSFNDQDAKIKRGVDVLIATPGRLLDHFERGKLLLTGVELLVIDEADRMLDMGFIPDIEKICKMVPAKRQTVFFSATMAPEIQRITDTFLRDPERIEVARPSSTAKTITQCRLNAPKDFESKRALLRDALRSFEDLNSAIIFCNRKVDISVVHRSLAQHKFKVVCLHGDMDQRARMVALDHFKNGDANILVASDVAARGLDIPDVSHVINFDIPRNAEDYVHRIGRTGRAGRLGFALSLVSPGDVENIEKVEALIQQPLTVYEGIRAPEPVKARARAVETAKKETDGRGGNRTRRPVAPESVEDTHVLPAFMESKPIRMESIPYAEERFDSRPSHRSEGRSYNQNISSRSNPPPLREERPRRMPRQSSLDSEYTPLGFGDHIPLFFARQMAV
jgi:superfamily II DNA/RNA helicase